MNSGNSQSLNLPWREANSSPRSVYVHIPFCRHRCGYCNFSLVAGREDLVESFIQALSIEVAAVAKHEIDTLFLGGGTPSFLNEKQLGRVGEILFERFELAAGYEFTAECNPSDIDANKLNALRAMGVNRISLGVQSLAASKLKMLQRDHSPAQAKAAFESSMSQVGNVSLDLIFAAPEESQSDWCKDLDAAIALGPSHLSTYELTWEKGTQFWSRLNKGQLSESDEETRATMYTAAIDRCESAGLMQYEVSSFAEDGKQCRHNLSYWLGNPWFAFGPSAASFVGGVRSTSHPSPTTWMKKTIAGSSTVYQREALSRTQSALERLVFGIRMVRGVSLDDLKLVTGVDLGSIAGPQLAEFESLRLLEQKNGEVRLTHRGRMLADGISEKLLSLSDTD